MPGKQNKCVWMHACRCRAQSSWPLIIFRERERNNSVVFYCRQWRFSWHWRVNARKPPPPESGGHMQTTTQKLAALFPALEQFTTFHLKMRLILFLLRAFKHASHQKACESLLNTHTLSHLFLYIYMNALVSSTDGLKFVRIKMRAEERDFFHQRSEQYAPEPFTMLCGNFCWLIF